MHGTQFLQPFHMHQTVVWFHMFKENDRPVLPDFRLRNASSKRIPKEIPVWFCVGGSWWSLRISRARSERLNAAHKSSSKLQNHDHIDDFFFCTKNGQLNWILQPLKAILWSTFPFLFFGFFLRGCPFTFVTFISQERTRRNSWSRGDIPCKPNTKILICPCDRKKIGQWKHPICTIWSGLAHKTSKRQVSHEKQKQEKSYCRQTPKKANWLIWVRALLINAHKNASDKDLARTQNAIFHLANEHLHVKVRRRKCKWQTKQAGLKKNGFLGEGVGLRDRK